MHYLELVEMLKQMGFLRDEWFFFFFFIYIKENNNQRK